jgi:hypothetical protein
VDRWDDKLTGQKRSAMKIVAASISRVRSTLPPRDAGAAAEGAAAPEEAPWDALPPPSASPPRRAAAATSQQQQMTTEEKWMDFFMNPDSERLLNLPGCACSAREPFTPCTGLLLLLPPSACHHSLLPAFRSVPRLLPHCPLRFADWHDNRLTKTKPTQPDFKKKEGGMGGESVFFA